MIYLDTSVALAALLSEDRRPPDDLWRQPLIASRLLEYELWVRLHARALGTSHADAAKHLLAHVALIELADPILQRARESFPVAVRTLDALHLASIEFLRAQGGSIVIATYDTRLGAAADALGIELYPL